jgi:prolyl-tRNA synthetase
MRWTKFFIPTTKETPAEATVPSHQLMLRAGLIRQVVAGAYSYLPLGYRSLRKIEAIVREEMNAAGGIELNMPAMHPIEWWEQTGRVEAMGDVLVRLGGRGDDWRSRTVLGPTHEEVITEIARAYLSSYKQLPVALYQIQTKFRGEARPKSGVLRTREFLMKDAYSFHASKEGAGGLDETYDRMYKAYCAIFQRCGLPYVVVEAESGAIGGDASHEFMVKTDAGEDFLVETQDGTYAANLERAELATTKASPGSGDASLQEVHTPNCPGIDDVCAKLGCESRQMIKTLVYEVEHSSEATIVQSGKQASELGRATSADGRGSSSGGHLEDLIVCVRGDHDVNENKLRRLRPDTQIRLADVATAKGEGFEIGYVGPQVVNQKPAATLVIDPDARAVVDAVTGANKVDHHVTGFNWLREVDRERLSNAIIADVRFAVEGDLAPNGSPLRIKKCIEVGHVFKLGTKYSLAMEATFLDHNGKPQPFIMGCYGIGLNRIMAATIEAFHDDKGISWPMTIAPFQVVICALDVREESVNVLAAKLHDELEAVGVDVLLDDRDARPGFKFKDAELIGFPIRVTVGKRGLADGIVEIQVRRTGELIKIDFPQATAKVKELVDRGMRDERT